MTDFKRARQADQKAVRRRALLDAAAVLFDAGGPTGPGINAIAAHAGFTKSNIYRYFESREHVLLELFLNEFDEFCSRVALEIEKVEAGDVAGVADAITQGFVLRPRLCRLVAIFGTVLEQNVSAATIEAIKTVLRDLTEPLVESMARGLRCAEIEDCHWAFAMTTSLLAGMWPGVSLAQSVASVLEQPQFARMSLSLDREFRRAVVALLSSITESGLPSRPLAEA